MKTNVIKKFAKLYDKKVLHGNAIKTQYYSIVKTHNSMENIALQSV